MGPAKKKDLLIICLLITGTFLLIALQYSPTDVVATGSVLYGDDTFTMTVAHQRIVRFYLNRSGDPATYSCAIRHFDAGTKISLVTGFSKEQVEIHEATIRRECDAVALVSSERECVYSTDQELIARLRKAPNEIPARSSVFWSIVIWKTVKWAFVYVIAYILLSTFEPVEDDRTCEDRLRT